jgi:rod shape-determining protein MreC
MAEDTRFKYFPEIRQAIAVFIYPIQILANTPIVIYETAEELLANFYLVEENAYLKQRYFTDREQLLKLQALETENVHLRNLLGAIRRTETTATMAEILDAPRDPFNHKAILNKGRRNGIQPGQVVVDDVGIIGQITQVYPWASEITLITDKDHSVPIQAVRNGLRSIISGAGKNSELELRHLSVDTDIQLGDLLVTSGIGGVYPPGLPVAKVAKIESDPAFEFAGITCTPIAGVDRNRQVLILSPIPPVPEDPSDISEMDVMNNQCNEDCANQ